MSAGPAETGRTRLYESRKHPTCAYPLTVGVVAEHEADALDVVDEALIEEVDEAEREVDAVPVPVEDEAVPVPVLEDAVPVPVDDEAVPVPVDEEAVPVPLNEEVVPVPVLDEAVPVPVVDDKLDVPVPETELLDPGVYTNVVNVHVPPHMRLELPAHGLLHDVAGVARSFPGGLSVEPQ